jgi:hypothetical protein
MIRTYKEILLATNPVVVCGDQHATWVNFERNVQFLETVVYGLPLSTTRSWTRSARSREMVQRLTTLNPNNDASELAQYVVFLRKIVRNHFRLWRLLFTILILSWPTTVTVYLASALTGDTGLAKALRGVLYALAPFWLVGLIIYIRDCTLNYRFVKSPHVRTWDELPLELYPRTAKEDKDIAYGMWAILQRHGATGLPRPDYSSSTAEIHRIFTLNLLTTTQSLTPLLLAAVKNVTGPSWVPDWNSHESHGLGANVEEIQDTDESGFNRSTKRSTGWFRFNENGTSIDVQGLSVGEVTLIFRIKSTSEEYQESEQGLHLDNLSLFLECALRRPYFLCRVLSVLDINLNLKSFLPGVDKKTRRNWRFFFRDDVVSRVMQLRRYTRGDPTQTLTRLREDHALFKAHTKISNFLAGNKRVVFAAKCQESLVGRSYTRAHTKSRSEIRLCVLRACLNSLSCGLTLTHLDHSGLLARLCMLTASGRHQRLCLISTGFTA